MGTILYGLVVALLPEDLYCGSGTSNPLILAVTLPQFGAAVGEYMQSGTHSLALILTNIVT